MRNVSIALIIMLAGFAAAGAAPKAAGPASAAPATAPATAPAAPAAQAPVAQVPAAEPKPKGRFGLAFNFLDPLVGALPYYDGYQFGAGARLKFDGRLALRGAAGLYSNTPAIGDATSVFTFGAGIEFHGGGGLISPFAGAIAGIGLETAAGATETSLYVGAVAGAELRLTDNLALFGEYQAKLIVSPAGTTVAIGDMGQPASGAGFGLILYF